MVRSHHPYIPSGFLCLLMLMSLGLPSASWAKAGKANPANFAILVDTSGSMVAYYQHRDPRPCLALELIQSLITETMAKGDRLVVLSFDHELHDAPCEIVALNPLAPSTAIQELQKLNLEPRAGEGTARTAALGRGIKALEALTASPQEFAGGILFVVTDRDGDRVPAGSARDYYNDALSLQKSGKLSLLSRIPQGNMILEMWHLKEHTGAPQPASPVDTISKVKTLLKKIIDRGHIPSSDVALDFEQGRLLLKTGRAWKSLAGKDTAFELPVTLTSQYKAFHFQGKLELKPAISVRGKVGNKRANLVVSFNRSPLILAPGTTITGTLKLTGLVSPGLFALSPKRVQCRIAPVADGIATTVPSLFQAPDPATTARVTQAIWVDPCQPPVALEPIQLPAIPPLNPPRGLQILLLAAVLGIFWGICRWARKRKPAVLNVHYWVSGAGNPEIATLVKPGASFPLLGVNATITREQVSAVAVSAGENAHLLDMSDGEQSKILFTSGGLFQVRNATGDISIVSMDFEQDPPRPSDMAGNVQKSAGEPPDDRTVDNDDWINV